LISTDWISFRITARRPGRWYSITMCTWYRAGRATTCCDPGRRTRPIRLNCAQ